MRMHRRSIEGCTTSMAFRPPPKRANNGDEGGSQPKRGRTGNGEPRDPIQNRSELSNRAYDKLVELSVGVRECKEELKIVRDNQRGLGIQLKKWKKTKKRLCLSLILSRKPLLPSKGVNMKSVSRHVVLVYLLMLHP